MARKVKEIIGEAKPKFDAVECNRVLDEANRQAKNAAEYTGSLGSVIKLGSEKLGLVRGALTGARRLDNKTPSKRDAEIADLLKVFEARGFFAQTDAFEDGARSVLLAIADRIKAAEAAQDEKPKKRNVTANMQALSEVLN